MEIYLVTFENDDGFPDKEIALVTVVMNEALSKIKKRPKAYALSRIEIWINGKRKKVVIYKDDFQNPTIIR